jgi:hypothetical protein
MLYHENKEECEGDPYFLNAVVACERKNDLPNRHFREDVKRMTQALINGRKAGMRSGSSYRTGTASSPISRGGR